VLRIDRRDATAVIAIDRPDRRNALDRATLDDLYAAVGALDADVRVLLLTGAGGHFCAGADLSVVEDEAFVARVNDLLVRLVDLPVVTMVAASGAALGLGTQLAVACDLRVATADARFGIPAGRLGLAVDAWTVRRVAMVAGSGPAQAMLLAAEVYTGDHLHRLGAVQRLGDLDDALAWADDVAALAPLTLQAHKSALALDGGGVAGDAGSVEAARKRAWASEDLQEGLAAFRDRRTAGFQGR
jgi:enoyl-CoA hydratase